MIQDLLISLQMNQISLFFFVVAKIQNNIPRIENSFKILLNSDIRIEELD